jgi:hypothetical protein
MEVGPFPIAQSIVPELSDGLGKFSSAGKYPFPRGLGKITQLLRKKKMFQLLNLFQAIKDFGEFGDSVRVQ